MGIIDRSHVRLEVAPLSSGTLPHARHTQVSTMTGTNPTPSIGVFNAHPTLHAHSAHKPSHRYPQRVHHTAYPTTCMQIDNPHESQIDLAEVSAVEAMLTDEYPDVLILMHRVRPLSLLLNLLLKDHYFFYLSSFALGLSLTGQTSRHRGDGSVCSARCRGCTRCGWPH